MGSQSLVAISSPDSSFATSEPSAAAPYVLVVKSRDDIEKFAQFLPMLARAGAGLGKVRQGIGGALQSASGGLGQMAQSAKGGLGQMAQSASGAYESAKGGLGQMAQRAADTRFGQLVNQAHDGLGAAMDELPGGKPTKLALGYMGYRGIQNKVRQAEQQNTAEQERITQIGEQARQKADTGGGQVGVR